MIYRVIADLLLHLALLFTILFLFWYYVIRKYQQEQINNLITEFLHVTSDDAVEYMYVSLGLLGHRDTLHSSIENIGKTLQYDLNEKTFTLERDHDNVRGSGITIIALLWTLVIVTFYGLWHQDPSVWKGIVVSNIVIVLLLFAMEYGFYTWIIKKYVPITESEIRNVVYTQLEAKLKTLIERIEST